MVQLPGAAEGKDYGISVLGQECAAVGTGMCMFKEDGGWTAGENAELVPLQNKPERDEDCGRRGQRGVEI